MHEWSEAALAADKRYPLGITFEESLSILCEVVTRKDRLMSISSVPGVQFIPATHRCYQHAIDFVVATSSIASYINAYHNKPVTTFAPHLARGAPQYPTIQFQEQASGRNVAFVPDDLLRSVFLQSKRNDPIAYLVSSTFDQISGAVTDAIAETYEGLAQAMLTGYYETNLSEIERVHGKRKNGGWPIVLQFAAIVRDTMSHGGVIHMFPSVQPVTYFGLTYSPSSNGRKIIHNDLSCADIFFLMLDADASF